MNPKASAEAASLVELEAKRHAICGGHASIPDSGIKCSRYVVSVVLVGDVLTPDAETPFAALGDNAGPKDQ